MIEYPKNNMIKICLWILFICLPVFGNSNLTILYHPSSLKFKDHDYLQQNDLKEIFSVSLGFSSEGTSNFKGLIIEDPFTVAKAVVTVVIDGTTEINNEKAYTFPLIVVDSEFGNVFSQVKNRIIERYPNDNDNLMIRIDLSKNLNEIKQNKLFQKIDETEIKKNNFISKSSEEKEFFEEIGKLNAILDAMEHFNKIKGAPDLYWFKINSYHPILDYYGENSTQVLEAKEILNYALSRLNIIFKNAYKGHVLITVITNDASHTRRARNILQITEAKDDFENLNLAKNYSPDYPVIFNIILWFGVAMVFTLLAICIAIGTMDPGRDSIIYRMTSNRMKKDN